MSDAFNDNRAILELAAIAVDVAAKDGHPLNLRALIGRLLGHRPGRTLMPSEIETAIIELAAVKGLTV